MNLQKITAAGIDLTYIRTVSNGDRHFEQDMISSLVVEIDENIKALITEAAGGQKDGIRLHAHSLKNLFGILGAGPLTEGFAALEKDSFLTGGEALVQTVLQQEHRWNEIKEVLSEVLAGPVA